jgi:hypothetical protein
MGRRLYTCIKTYFDITRKAFKITTKHNKLKEIKAMKRYDELSESLKEIAIKLHPQDYKEWFYMVQGVEIVWSAK